MHETHAAVAPAGGARATPPAVTPAPIIEATFAFSQSCILLAAVELGLFTAVSEGAGTAALIAARCGCDEPALRRLLGSLCAMGFLARAGGGYELTPVSARFLVRGDDGYIGDVALQIRQEWTAWSGLTDVVRTGRPARSITDPALGGEFFAPLSDALFPLVHPLMARIGRRLGLGDGGQGRHVLDLGAGAGPEAIAALELDSGATAMLVDFPEVLDRARARARQRRLEDRMVFVASTLERMRLPATTFDLAFASHVLRIVGRETTRRVLRECHAALRAGGRLVIVETYHAPDPDTRLFPNVVSVNMLVNTPHGDTFTVAEMRALVEDAGFDVDLWSDMGPDPVLVATRGGGEP
jgi:SAM-dependent methyltransferase